jgi:integrase
MGAISQRTTNKGPTTWQAKIRRKGHPFLSASFASRTDAEEWVRKVEAEFDANRVVLAADKARAKLSKSHNPAHLPLGYLIDRYIAEVTPTKRSATTEAIQLKAMKRQSIAAYTLSQLTPQVLREWRDHRLTKVSGDTVNRGLNTLSHLIETARKEWGAAIAENPVSLIRRPKPNPSRERRLMPGEEVALLTSADRGKGGFLRSVIILAIETGMRRSEIVGLEWEHIHLERRYLHLTVTKNGSPRGVPLSRKALAVLEALPERSGSVFPGVTVEAVKRAFQNACKRCGIVDLRFHDLRHEAISRLFEKGLNPMEAASISGHKTLSMLKRYTHLDAGKLASRLD